MKLSKEGLEVILEFRISLKMSVTVARIWLLHLLNNKIAPGTDFALCFCVFVENSKTNTSDQ